MKEFISLLSQEQEGIELSLKNVINTLPPSVQELAAYSLLSGGKRLRPFLSLLCAKIFNPNICAIQKDIYDAAIVLEMFHVASLLHDDVLDNADTRRGKTSAHLEFGIRSCLLAGDALLAAGNRQMAEIAQKYNNFELMNSISNALLHTSCGEIEEISYVGKILPDLHAYCQIIEGKTAYIIKSACEVGALMAGAKKEDVQNMATFGLNLGMAFQIIDDALDFAPESQTGKPCGGDLRERKCTPPILMYANSLSKEERKDFEAKFAIIPTPEFEKAHQSKKIGFSQEESDKIIDEIITQELPEKTKQLADTYLNLAKIALEKYSIDKYDCEYSKILLQVLEYVQMRKK